MLPLHELESYTILVLDLGTDEHRAVPANSGAPVRNNGLGPSDLVKDHEYQAIPVGKRDMLCESTNVRSHTNAMCCVKAQMLEVIRVTDS